jgi:CheY-like chemotaxis protein
MANHRTVLLVESAPTVLDAIGFALRSRGYHVLTATDGGRAVELLARHIPDAVVVNMFLPGQSGFQVARLVKERSDGRVPVLMLAAAAADAHADYALSLGIEGFLVNSPATDVASAVDVVWRGTIRDTRNVEEGAIAAQE